MALLACAGLAAGARDAAAGPWPLGRGRTYAKLAYQHLRSTELASPDGTIFPIPEFTKQELSVSALYGLSGGVTLQAYVPFVRSSDVDDALDELDRETGFGDVQLGLQWQLGRRGSWVFAARGVVQAPTGDETRAQGLLPTGSGVWEGSLVVGAGRSLAGGRGYGFVEAGPQFRGGDLTDGVVYALQVGWRAGGRTVVAANLYGVQPYRQQAPGVAIGAPAGTGDRVTYTSYGPSLMLEIGKALTLQVDLETAFNTHNLAKGPVIRAGLAFTR